MDKQDGDIVYKVCLIGTVEVGKTSIINRYLQPEGDMKDISPTQSEVMHEFNVEVDGNTVSLQVFDRGGESDRSEVTQTFFRGADAVIFVYAVNDQGSFDILEEIQDTAFSSSKDPTAL
jgi:small GTP-binding protein